MRVSLALLLLLSACGHGLGDGLQIRGKLGAEFGAMPAARSADSGTVDTLVAVPHIGGVAVLDEAHSVPASADDRFEITVDDSYDHLLMLVDSTTADPTILAFLALPASTETVVDLTTSEATEDVDAGSVEASGGEAVGDEEEEAEALGLTAEQFALLAAADDGFKNIANAWLNTDLDAGVRTVAGVNFQFEGAFASADEPGIDYAGSSLSFTTDDPRLAIAGACDGSLRVEIVPPAAVSLGGVAYGPDNPVSNADTVDCQGAMTFAQFPEGVALQLPGADGPLPEGWWSWQVDGEEIGFFRLDFAAPVDASGAARVPSPSLVLTERDGGVDVAIHWWVEAGGGIVELADASVLRRVLASSGLTVSTDGSGGEWQGGWDGELELDGSGDTPGQIVGEIALGYVLAGTQYTFTWRGNAVCGNGIRESGEVCDGDNDVSVSCGDLGLYEPGYVSCTGCELDPSTCAHGFAATAASADTLDASQAANTVAWRVGLDTFDLEGVDVWAQLIPEGTSPIALADLEDGIRHLGRMSYAVEELVAFQVSPPGAGSAASGRLRLWDGPPDSSASPSVIWDGPARTWQTAASTAVADPSATLVSEQPFAPLGATRTLRLTGHIEGLAGSHRVSVDAATAAGWDARHVELVHSEVSAVVAGSADPARLCVDAACTVDGERIGDQLVFFAPEAEAIDWQAELVFRIAAPVSQPTSIGVRSEAAGGEERAPSASTTLDRAEQALLVAVEDLNAGIAMDPLAPATTLQLSITNPSAHDVLVDHVGFSLPEGGTSTGPLHITDAEGSFVPDLAPMLLDSGQALIVGSDVLRIPAGGTTTVEAPVAFAAGGLATVGAWVAIGEVLVGDSIHLAIPELETSCPAGEFDLGGTCTACPSGQTSVEGGASCFPCPEDTWLDGVRCTACPEGSASPAGSVAASDCIELALPPTVLSLDFSPRNDGGIDSSPGGAVTLTATSEAQSSYPVQSVVFRIAAPDGTVQALSAPPDVPVVWAVPADADPGAYSLAAVAANTAGSSQLLEHPEPIDIGDPPPQLVSFLASDPDNDDPAYAAGDRLTLRFDVPTSRGGVAVAQTLDKAAVDAAFAFSSPIGLDYQGQWLDDATFAIELLVPGATAPALGATTARALVGGDVRLAGELSIPSTSVSPALAGNWGFGGTAPAVLAAWPPTVEVGLAHGEAATVELELTNVGLVDLADVSIELVDAAGGPAPSWASLTSASAIPVLDRGEQTAVTAALAPDTSVPTTAFEPERFAVEVRTAGELLLSVPVRAWVDLPGEGALLVKVEDPLTGTFDEQGQVREGVVGATVALDKVEGAPHHAVLLTDTAGEVLFQQLPVGEYELRTSAEGHQAIARHVSIAPLTQSEYAFLDMGAGAQQARASARAAADFYAGSLAASLDLSSPSAGASAVQVELPFWLNTEREVFDLSVDIANLDPTFPMNQVWVDLAIVDFAGVPQTWTSDLAAGPGTATFFVNEGAHDNLDAVDGSGSVAADTTATAHFTLVPSPEAALPSLEGTGYLLTFSVGWSQNLVSREADVPVGAVYVAPHPDLWLDAHTDPTWVSDNPYTGAIEATEPAALGLRIANRGRMPMAADLVLGSPVITDAGGQGFTASIAGASLDGVVLADPSAAAIGTIGGGEARMLRWQVEGSHLAGVGALSVSLGHGVALGGELTSVARAADAVCSRDALAELPGRDALRDILSLGECDASTGLTLYESDLVDLPIEDRTQGQALVDLGAGEYTWSMAGAAGWVHGLVPVPSAVDGWTLTGCEREDGKRLDPANCYVDLVLDSGAACGGPAVCTAAHVALFDEADPAAPAYALLFAP